MDGRNPASPKNPWNDDPLSMPTNNVVHQENPGFSSMVADCARNMWPFSGHRSGSGPSRGARRDASDVRRRTGEMSASRVLGVGMNQIWWLKQRNLAQY